MNDGEETEEMKILLLRLPPSGSVLFLITLADCILVSSKTK